MNSLDARDTATAPSCATCFFECKHFTLFLIFPSVEARFRTSVLNRHSRVYVADSMISQIRSTPCACGSLCAHREPHAQGVLHVCCKQTLKTAMGALVTGFCCSSTMTITNLLHQQRAIVVTLLPGKIIHPEHPHRSCHRSWKLHQMA